MWSHSQKGPQVLLLQWRPPASVPLGGGHGGGSWGLQKSVDEGSPVPWSPAVDLRAAIQAVITFFPLSMKFWPKLRSFWSKSGKFFSHTAAEENNLLWKAKFRTTRAILRPETITSQCTHNSNSALSVNSCLSEHKISILLGKLHRHLY